VISIGEQRRVGSLSLVADIPTTCRFDLAGFIVHTLHNPNRQLYTQLFRNGGIDAMSANAIAASDERHGFFATGMERSVIGACNR